MIKGTYICIVSVVTHRILVSLIIISSRTLPLRFLWPKVDNLYKTVCIHCWSGELWYQKVLLSIQVIFAILFTVGYYSQVMATMSWILYFSLTLRNTWLNFILDRYFHYLLFYAIFLPTDTCWSVVCKRRDNKSMVLSLATVVLKCQVLWIYLDAGGGKLLDPLGGWTWHATIPALDSYARHTVGARYLYALLRPLGLRILTPLVVYAELLSAPCAMVASYFGNARIVYIAVSLICGLHVGIAITLRNTVLLSLVACSVYCTFLPHWVATSLESLLLAGPNNKLQYWVDFQSVHPRTCGWLTLVGTL